MNAKTEPDIDPAAQARPSTPADHRLRTDDGKCSVVFSWCADRYAHVIESTDGSRLLSVEGTPADDWPSSATISQLSTEVIDGRPTVLGVGSSGTTHFSVSVQMELTGNAGPALRFDWAARLARPLSAADIANTAASSEKQSLAWLGSTYHSPTGTPAHWNIETIASTSMEQDSDDSRGKLSLQPTSMDDVRTVEWSYRIKIG
ncbi:hypothetical protein [Allorhodopirellula solitaria]|uniref:Uncharacterized protein n=1 Tax=Allorhodopirellula solitaria TaxID=2527987 RepID=A0A5C5XUB5_9BACT|nr:hypothetical protein [Allorhodopirellula solitaria]TWT65192.1 hypothetical protein CA85_31010 [Allorhodopirellula solitaria]